MHVSSPCSITHMMPQLAARFPTLLLHPSAGAIASDVAATRRIPPAPAAVRASVDMCAAALCDAFEELERQKAVTEDGWSGGYSYAGGWP